MLIYLFNYYTGINLKKKEIREAVFQAVGFVPNNKNKIYLYGFGNNFKLWVNVLIHENYHILLDLFNIKDVYHHKIIKKLGREKYAQEIYKNNS